MHDAYNVQCKSHEYTLETAACTHVEGHEQSQYLNIVAINYTKNAGYIR